MRSIVKRRSVKRSDKVKRRSIKRSDKVKRRSDKVKRRSDKRSDKVKKAHKVRRSVKRSDKSKIYKIGKGPAEINTIKTSVSTLQDENGITDGFITDLINIKPDDIATIIENRKNSQSKYDNVVDKLRNDKDIRTLQDNYDKLQQMYNDIYEDQIDKTVNIKNLKGYKGYIKQLQETVQSINDYLNNLKVDLYLQLTPAALTKTTKLEQFKETKLYQGTASLVNKLAPSNNTQTTFNKINPFAKSGKFK